MIDVYEENKTMKLLSRITIKPNEKEMNDLNNLRDAYMKQADTYVDWCEPGDQRNIGMYLNAKNCLKEILNPGSLLQSIYHLGMWHGVKIARAANKKNIPCHELLNNGRG